MEHQPNDRLSFRNFVGLSNEDKVPDAKTIWFFNDRLSKAGEAQYKIDLADKSVSTWGEFPATY